MGELVEPLEPKVIVLSAAAPTVLTGALDDLRALARRVPVAIGGRGINEALANDIGARMLTGDPVSAAAEVAKS
jgi:hypothetical protein